MPSAHKAKGPSLKLDLIGQAPATVAREGAGDRLPKAILQAHNPVFAWRREWRHLLFMLEHYFDRIYIINLVSRTDRRAEMAADLARIGLSFEDQAVTLFPAVKPEDAGGFPSIGARGCFMSHLNILRDAQERGAGSIAILEDDLELIPNFIDTASGILEALAQSQWSIFYGGYEGASFEGDAFVEVPSDTGLKTTHFICLNRQAIGLAIEYFEAMIGRPGGDPEGGPMHVDGAYSWFRKAHPELVVYAANPPIGNQRSSRSDIAPLQWYDRTPFVKQIATLARQALRLTRSSD